MIRFPVSEEKNTFLHQRMAYLGIEEKDIEEKFVRSSKKGGQKVNKASTCVYLKHRPTGIEVKWMTERSQALNRFFARRELIRRVERLKGLGTQEDMESKRIRKQKSKRKKRAGQKYGSPDLSLLREKG